MAIFKKINIENKALVISLTSMKKDIDLLQKELLAVFAIFEIIKGIPALLRVPLASIKKAAGVFAKVVSAIPGVGYFKLVKTPLKNSLKGIKQLVATLETNLKIFDKIIRRVPDVSFIKLPFILVSNQLLQIKKIISKAIALIALLEKQEPKMDADPKYKPLLDKFKNYPDKIKKLREEIDKIDAELKKSIIELIARKKALNILLKSLNTITPKLNKFAKSIKSVADSISQKMKALKPILTELNKVMSKITNIANKGIKWLGDVLDTAGKFYAKQLGVEEKYNKFKRQAKKLYKKALTLIDAIKDLVAELLSEMEGIKEIFKFFEDIEKEVRKTVKEIEKVIEQHIRDAQKSYKKITEEFQKLIEEAEKAFIGKEINEKQVLKDIYDLYKEIKAFKEYLKLIKQILKDKLKEQNKNERKKNVSQLKNQVGGRSYAILHKILGKDLYFLKERETFEAIDVQTKAIDLYQESAVIIASHLEHTVEVAELELDHEYQEILEGYLNQTILLEKHLFKLHETAKEDANVSEIANLKAYFKEANKVINTDFEKLKKFKPGKYVTEGLVETDMADFKFDFAYDELSFELEKLSQLLDISDVEITAKLKSKLFKANRAFDVFHEIANNTIKINNDLEKALKEY